MGGRHVKMSLKQRMNISAAHSVWSAVYWRDTTKGSPRVYSGDTVSHTATECAAGADLYQCVPYVSLSC